MMNTFLDAMRMVGIGALAVGIAYFAGGLSLDHSGFVQFGFLSLVAGGVIVGISSGKPRKRSGRW